MQNTKHYNKGIGKTDMKKPLLIMFDWDNTLAISRQAVVESMNYVLSKYGLEEWDIAKKKYQDKNKSLKDNFINFFKDKAEQASEHPSNFLRLL